MPEPSQVETYGTFLTPDGTLVAILGLIAFLVFFCCLTIPVRHYCHDDTCPRRKKEVGK